MRGEHNLEAIVELTPETFEEEVLKASGLVMVKFYAEYCADCRAMEPIYKEISKEYKDRIKFTRLHVNGGNPYTAIYSIRKVPTIILFKDGKVIDKIVEPLQKEFINWMEQILDRD